jgi:hypothetical protein
LLQSYYVHLYSPDTGSWYDYQNYVNLGSKNIPNSSVVDPDPHHFGNPAPDSDPHQIKIRVRIRIKVRRIRNTDEQSTQDQTRQEAHGSGSERNIYRSRTHEMRKNRDLTWVVVVGVPQAHNY